jgi:hypothetical protein
MASPAVLYHDAFVQPAPAVHIPLEWRGCLNTLRMIALQCRSAAHTDLFKACALLSNKEDTAKDAHARALLKCLRQAVSIQPVFYRPGVTELSFDEAWLMRAIMAIGGGDQDSFSFLIRSRVPKLHQRHVAFLIKGISEQFRQI